MLIYYIFFYISIVYIYYRVCSLLDIDECSEAYAVKMYNCHPNASCINTQSSYNCSCNPTYIGDSFNCKGMVVFLKAMKIYIL